MSASLRRFLSFSSSPSWRSRFPELSRIDSERARGITPPTRSSLASAEDSRPGASLAYADVNSNVLVLPPHGSMAAATLLARAPLVRSRMRRVLHRDRLDAGRSPPPVLLTPSSAVAPLDQVQAHPIAHPPVISLSTSVPTAVPLSILTVALRRAAHTEKVGTALSDFDRLLVSAKMSPTLTASLNALRSALVATTKGGCWLPSWISSSIRAQAKIRSWLSRFSIVLMLALVTTSLLATLSDGPTARWSWIAFSVVLLALLAWDDRGRLTNLGFAERGLVYRHLSLSRMGFLSGSPAVTHAIVSWCDNPRATRSSVLRLDKSLAELLAVVAKA